MSYYRFKTIKKTFVLIAKSQITAIRSEEIETRFKLKRLQFDQRRIGQNYEEKIL